jgi:hypothetical protein
MANASDRHHLIITGTGRAGTTFLVRYLTALGFDTHLSRRSDPHFDPWAKAGLEDNPLQTSPRDLPYVLKSPWLYELVDDLFARGMIKFDAAIIPVRDLREAAISRVTVERRAIHRDAPWMASQSTSWKTWGWPAGGVAFSLDPLDQERILAVGFHNVVQRLVHADVPLLFLSFPRLVRDSRYVYDKLRPLFPPHVTEEFALQAHADSLELDDEERRRSEKQVNSAGRAMNVCANDAVNEKLDAIALRKEIIRLRAELDSIHAGMLWRLRDFLRKVVRRTA